MCSRAKAVPANQRPHVCRAAGKADPHLLRARFDNQHVRALHQSERSVGTGQREVVPPRRRHARDHRGGPDRNDGHGITCAFAHQHVSAVGVHPQRGGGGRQCDGFLDRLRVPVDHQHRLAAAKCHVHAVTAGRCDCVDRPIWQPHRCRSREVANAHSSESGIAKEVHAVADFRAHHKLRVRHGYRVQHARIRWSKPGESGALAARRGQDQRPVRHGNECVRRGIGMKCPGAARCQAADLVARCETEDGPAVGARERRERRGSCRLGCTHAQFESAGRASLVDVGKGSLHVVESQHALDVRAVRFRLPQQGIGGPSVRGGQSAVSRQPHEDRIQFAGGARRRRRSSCPLS